VTQTAEEIKRVAMEFDNAIEARDIEAMVSSFADDCEIELLGLTLRGKDGVRTWIDWLFGNIPDIKFIPINIIVEGNVFFEEFVAITKLADGTEVRSKQAEVLIYEDYKIKSLRLYFDRLDFSDAISGNFLSRKVVQIVKDRSLKGLQ
jgi:ketosteroid isomerase-like protein